MFDAILFLRLNRSLDEVEEEGMWLENGAFIFRLEYDAYIPFQFGYFNDFNQLAVVVDAHALHTSFFKGIEIFVVELIAMAMTLADGFRTIDFAHHATLSQLTVIAAQAEGAACVAHSLQVVHCVDNFMLCLRVNLGAVGIGVAQNGAGKFNSHHLHAQSDTEGGNIVFAAMLCGDNFALNTALTSTWTDNDTIHAFELLSHVFRGEFVALNEVCLHFAVVVCSSLRKGFEDTLIGIL